MRKKGRMRKARGGRVQPKGAGWASPRPTCACILPLNSAFRAPDGLGVVWNAFSVTAASVGKRRGRARSGRVASAAASAAGGGGAGGGGDPVLKGCANRLPPDYSGRVPINNKRGAIEQLRHIIRVTKKGGKRLNGG